MLCPSGGIREIELEIDNKLSTLGKTAKLFMYDDGHDGKF